MIENYIQISSETIMYQTLDSMHSFYNFSSSIIINGCSKRIKFLNPSLLLEEKMDKNIESIINRPMYCL
ncbi:MAG: hypothetical protein Ct9H300mP23_00440 [Nitrospinota bacterium]|nr:MAG: hypothetical protein Ct9H300mP23_00440 [Nitrospinota bacterium]